MLENIHIFLAKSNEDRLIVTSFGSTSAKASEKCGKMVCNRVDHAAVWHRGAPEK